MAYEDDELPQVGKVNSSLDQNGGGLALRVAHGRALGTHNSGAMANKELGWAIEWLLQG